jgi:hypothetical protein
MDASTAVKPDELIEEYIALRDEKKQAEEMFEEQVRLRYSDRMKTIEVTLLDMLNSLGIDSMKSDNGTAHKKITTSVTTADAREFRRHVVGNEQWDLADWKPNKTMINDMVERGEPIPPGVNRSAWYTISIRRATS